MSLAFSSNQLAFAQSTEGSPLFPTGPLPTDLTPIRLPEEREVFTPGPTFYLYNKLPPKLWFNVSVEANQRLDTNVFLKQTAYKTDYVYRTLPNITLGYTLFKGTSIYCNYFVIKDIYARTPVLTPPTTQSLSLGFRKTITIGEKSTLQLDFQSRELWQSRGLRQADLIPGVLFNRVLTPRLIAYSNIQLQMRGADYFVAPTRELDPFYTIGFLYSRGNWVFSAVDTFITNYRHPMFTFSVPLHGNEAMIADFEVAHPVTKKVPSLVAFLRAEPVWNWNSGGTPGISGFDFRLYSGLRMSLNKTAHNTSVETLRKQLLEMQSEPKGTAAPSAAPTDSSQTPSGQTPSGQTPSGQTPSGQTPSGQTPSGQTPSGQTPSGQTPSGQTPSGQTPSGQTPSGQTPSGQTPSGTAPSSSTGSSSDQSDAPSNNSSIPSKQTFPEISKGLSLPAGSVQTAILSLPTKTPLPQMAPVAISLSSRERHSQQVSPMVIAALPMKAELRQLKPVLNETVAFNDAREQHQAWVCLDSSNEQNSTWNCLDSSAATP